QLEDADNLLALFQSSQSKTSLPSLPSLPSEQNSTNESPSSSPMTPSGTPTTVISRPVDHTSSFSLQTPTKKFSYPSSASPSPVTPLLPFAITPSVPSPSPSPTLPIKFPWTFPHARTSRLANSSPTMPSRPIC